MSWKPEYWKNGTENPIMVWLRALGLLSSQGSLRGTSWMGTNTWKRGWKCVLGSLQGCPRGREWNTGGSVCHTTVSVTEDGTSCPERLWRVHPLINSESLCDWAWAAWMFWMALLEQGLDKGTSEVPANLSHSLKTENTKPTLCDTF